MRQVAAALPVILLACVEAHPLGSVPEDNVRIADVPGLAHVQAALRFKHLRVRDLFSRRNVVLDSAPNPSALLAAHQAANGNYVVGGRLYSHGVAGEPLVVMTYNVALLKTLPVAAPYTRSPEIPARLPELPPRVLGLAHDVILLQEVWEDWAVHAFAAAAPAHGYRLFASERAPRTDGLVILVREAVIRDGEEPQLEQIPYDSDNHLESGPLIKRGILHLVFRHVKPEIGRVHVFNTHAQAVQISWPQRLRQARELGIAVREGTAEGEIALVGGDLNAAPYYRSDEWVTPGGTTQRDHWANALPWALALHYGGLVDLFAMGTDAQDVFLGDTVVNVGEDAARVPGGVAGWCDRTPNIVFTATDCNQLSFRQYAGTGPPGRIDHLFAHDPAGRVHVVASRLEFVERMTFDTGTFELSDHYGVSASLVIHR